MKRAALLVAVLLLAVPAGTGLASTVTLTPSGGGVFILEGQAFQDVSGLDIALSYDSAVLRDPHIDQGSLINGALMMSNTADPGIIRIAAVRQGPVQGSGTIARITFTATGQGGDGAVSGLNVSAVSSAGNKSLLSSFIGASSQDQAHPSQTTPAMTTPSIAAVAPPPTVAFVPAVPLTSPPVQLIQKNKEERAVPPSQEAENTDGNTAGVGEDPAVGVRDGGPPKPAGPAVREQQRLVLTQKSVLDLFREFPGPWNVQTAIKLFQQEEMLGYRQLPQIAFSDGADTATLTIIVAAGGKDRPEITMEKGTILSVVKDRESTNAWLVKVKPEKDAIEASLRVDDGVAVRSIPLTVSPRVKVDIDGSGTVTEKDFLLYFSSRGNEGGSAGRRNYRVDYIFAANYLAAAGQVMVRQKITAR
jgi:hypothetical protein